MGSMRENDAPAGDGIPILSSKLSPPRLHGIVPRNRLLQELDAAFSSRLVCMVAGAGFGKSTLAADFLNRCGCPYAWYQLEDTDCDLAVFMAYLAAALEAHGDEPLLASGKAVRVSRESRVDRWEKLAPFVAWMERHLEGDFFLVLDDFQEVNDSDEIISALDFMLSHLPRHLHMLILSTSELNLDLSKLRARREVVELREEQLCFSDEETAILLEDIFSLIMDEGDVASITALTEGWITGLILLSHALKSGEGVPADKMPYGGPVTSPVLFDYFDRVIYRKLDDKLKGFLLRTSILSRVEPEFCDNLLELDDSSRILSHLAASHLFVVPLDEAGTSYRYHHLLCSFLLDILARTVEAQEISHLHVKAAELWEESGEPEEALRHYLAAGEPEKAAARLQRMAEGLIRSGRFTYLRQAIESLPKPILHSHPKLIYFAAQCYERLGLYRQALERYETSASLFADRDDDDSRMDCMRDSLKLTILSGRAPEAEASLEEFVEIFEGTAVDMDSWFQTAALLSAGSAYLGMADRARHFIAASLARIDDVEEDGARLTMLTWCGYASLLLGEYRQAVGMLARAKALASEKEFMSHLPDICCLLSLTHSAMGKYVEARDMAEEGLRADESAGGEIPPHPISIQLRLARAISLDDVEEEEALLELARLCRLSEEGEDIWLSINCNLFSATTCLKAGDIQRSLQYFRKTEEICNEKGFLDDELLSSLSCIALTIDEKENAAEALQEAQRAFDSLQSRAAGVLRSASYLLLSSILFQSGDEDGALEMLAVAVAIDEKSGGLGWWKAYSRLVLPIMASAFARKENMGFLSEAFRAIGPLSLPFLYRLRRSAESEPRERAIELIEDMAGRYTEPLEINMLGSFVVTKGRGRIVDRDWKSRRALSVLKHLAAHHARGPLQRDVIIELLWPEMDPEKASKNLNVALSTIRKTLDPNADWGDSRYLVTSGNSLMLELGEGGWIDVELFTRRIEEARAAREAGDDHAFLQRCLEAEALYGGDFLAEDPYEEWSIPFREDLRKAYVDLLRGIVDYYIEAGMFDKALTYVQKALDNDPAREDLHRCAMIIYASQRNRAGLDRSFERCRSSLRDNLDISPSAETLELFEILRGRIEPT